jgi:tetratricopeptide (TPR) repeat protein
MNASCLFRLYLIDVIPLDFFTPKVSHVTALLWASSVFSAATLCAQAPVKQSQDSASFSVESAIDLAAKGHCQEALPVLKKSAKSIVSKDLRYRTAMATARCAMSLDQAEIVAQALWRLNGEFPDDPEVLYITTHYYSELASRASQRLASVAPSSHQAHQLEAEAAESQERWDDAIAEYGAILKQNPDLPGIHYRLGRIHLSQPETATSTDGAIREFEAELQVDPNNAAAEFFLGEIARRAGKWEEAIPHFANAAKFDPGFVEAFLALGMSLNSAERFAEAVRPLEKYVKDQPSDAAGHYQLSISYARIGRKQDATREMAIQEQTARKHPGGPSAGPNGEAPH